MPVKIACPKCSKKYTLPDSALGKAVKCKACETTFRTKAPGAAPAVLGLQPPLRVRANQRSNGRLDRDPLNRDPRNPPAPIQMSSGLMVGFKNKRTCLDRQRKLRLACRTFPTRTRLAMRSIQSWLDLLVLRRRLQKILFSR